MLSLLLAFTILTLPLVLARVASSSAKNSRRRELAPVRVRVQRQQMTRRSGR